MVMQQLGMGGQNVEVGRGQETWYRGNGAKMEVWQYRTKTGPDVQGEECLTLWTDVE